MSDPSGPVSFPPAARVDVVREVRFGVTLADPYRWMEAEDAELREWLSGQGENAAMMLAGLPGRAGFLTRVAELADGATRDSGFRLAVDRVFFRHQAAGAAVPVLMVADGGRDRRVLLDPAALPGREHRYLDWFVPSPDGRLVACGISEGGSERSTLRIVAADDGGLREDAVPGTLFGVVSWVPGSDALICQRFLDSPAGTPPYQRRNDSRACLHRLGTSADDDVVVLARGLNSRVPMAPIDRPRVYTPPGTDWMIALISHGVQGGAPGEEIADCSLYVAPRAALADPPGCPWQRVAGSAEGVTCYDIHGDRLYLLIDDGGSRCRVVSVPVAAPDLAAADVVVPESERAIAAILAVGDELLVHEIAAGVSRLSRVPLAGGQPTEVPLPVEGLIEPWTAHPVRSEVYITLGSWTQAPRVFRYSGSAGAVIDTGWLPPSAADSSGIVTCDLRVPARDGTLVPLRVAHRKGLVLDGGHPAILAGYGSYGEVAFRLVGPEMLVWCERGGVYAVAGLRGGGEYGREWHEAGRGLRKENTITDFIDCAEYLIGQGYTRPERLAGMGGSAGGIPVGGALVRRPDLWAAMVMQVPVTNTTRKEFSENGPVNVAETGSVSTEDGLRALLLTDCYLRVRGGTRYPAVLLTTGLNDPRVAVWQPAKMAARLQAATASGRPVLLRVDPHAGHGRGSTPTQRNELTADILAFLTHELTARTTTATA
jgi:prolyl oligopeptidase